ncbi:hypothetical protein EI77_00540 [Prosthecobacter fusiformis]|uniref:Uncharacterized protein n=1 Tax=Prosthecobacter fusiformis TaxID=48464 RepID=A0A4R7SSP5_9BACT|nr:hypothetical protein [Prosthecobacter fusiformis]TDU81237.1 hypothetical protein EI77_00540 [Prosthecobacter fusiformis]
MHLRKTNSPAGLGAQEKNPQNLKPIIYPAGLIYEYIQVELLQAIQKNDHSGKNSFFVDTMS